ncbi:hypothetical protein [Flavobacterium agrisoli]|uniref:Uncharacterized protein n=1 Tax=Flavobacterium agrisoli TaxID=2793066 RepID=A0A934PMK0_9FLAO|nr:hypothetical protein [Flavobacterium agrisoli]MBK0370962.1 hypothetical protein [Flavobacterium agrisoli]
MKRFFFKIVVSVFIFGCVLPMKAQCEIKNKVLADGSMMYFFDPSAFYTTKSKSLKINIMTDDENFFIALRPKPFPKKEDGIKLKNDLKIKLGNKSWYNLKHYDTQYVKHDSVLQVMYLIKKSDLEDFKLYEAEIASINMEGTEFVRNYAFKLHKKAIMQQLNCYEESKKKTMKVKNEDQK